MKNYSFFQLLDYELPRVIDEAVAWVNTCRESPVRAPEATFPIVPSLEQVDLTQTRNLPLDAVYPRMLGGASISVAAERTRKIKAVRDVLGDLSLAYAITRCERVAEVANRFIEQQLLGSDFLRERGAWESTCEHPSEGAGFEFHRVMFEVVLSLEMLRGLGCLSKAHERNLQPKLSRRLRRLGGWGLEGRALSEQLGWLLEQLVLSLFLDDRDVLERVGHTFSTGYVRRFTEWMEGPARETREGFQRGIDGYVAVGYWLSQSGQTDQSFLETVLTALSSVNDTSPSCWLTRGAWVLAERKPFTESALSQMSVFLLLGEGLGRPELIDGWMEFLESGPFQSGSQTPLITRPLLWIGSEEWSYQPFAECKTSSRGFYDGIQ